MTVRRDESGRRSVQVETLVPGTPEEVWAAIATGPGISAWFCPSEVEERVGGSVRCHIGPGMETDAAVTAWDPPRRFAADSPGPTPDAPPIATEWIVEPRSGGVCLVRVVHSLFASTDDWDDQLAGSESGWPYFFGILRLYLTHFRGRPAAVIRAMGTTPGAVSDAWDKLTGALAIPGSATSERWSSRPAGIRPLAGVVEHITEGRQPYALVRLDDPLPGIVAPSAFAAGDQVMITLGIYLYGDAAATATARDEPLWQAWLNELFE